jgi:WD40 repeat protein
LAVLDKLLKFSFPENLFSSLIYSPDEDIVCAVSMSYAHAYSIRDGTKLSSIEDADYGSINVSSNGKTIFAYNPHSHEAILWDVINARKIFSINLGANYKLKGSFFSSDDKVLAILKIKSIDKNSEAYAISIWNLLTGEEKEVEVTQLKKM